MIFPRSHKQLLKIIAPYFFLQNAIHLRLRFHGVMVSTLDFESGDPSSNLGGTFPFGEQF